MQKRDGIGTNGLSEQCFETNLVIIMAARMVMIATENNPNHRVLRNKVGDIPQYGLTRGAGNNVMNGDVPIHGHPDGEETETRVRGCMGGGGNGEEEGGEEVIDKKGGEKERGENAKLCNGRDGGREEGIPKGTVLLSDAMEKGEGGADVGGDGAEGALENE